VKYYLLGALIIYPVTFLWALSDAWSRGTERQYMIMLAYAVLGLPVLSVYFHRKTHFLVSRVFIYLFVIIVALVSFVLMIR
jgi:hypothetical protein